MVGVVAMAEELVHKVMGQWDSSHDPFHAFRVRDLALSLAKEEALPPNSLQIVELACLLHDIGKCKQGTESVADFLREQGVEAKSAEVILSIISSMGFKEELGGSLNHDQCSLEFAIVQDADRLDAIGAIGIARAFTYGGNRNHMIHDPDQAPRTNLTKMEYMHSDAKLTTLNHFHEKLLKLKGLMKTKAGKQRAEGRHKFMETYLQQFQGEWEGRL
ncbi:unnamed protein product [Sphagnum jensenii]|uniref:HD/PDEase domain-containing protein n=2 Tax=Sphagnum jensenii TaxID=128206 RepID=A0ABP0VSZ9_9BRYO